MADVEKIAAELRAGLEGVTSGRWETFPCKSLLRPEGRIGIQSRSGPLVADCGISCNTHSIPNAAHIVAAQPENIRALLDELSRLREVERRAKEVIRPFAEYMEDGMDLDNNGLPLPDEQGVGWIYLNHGRFRSARDLYRVLSEREGQDG